MSKISSAEDFRKALIALSLPLQRLVAARFIKNVLDLTTDKKLIAAQTIAASSDSTDDELKQAYNMAHSSYIESHPHAEMIALDWKKQADYFIAKACMTCLDPASLKDLKHHLALRVSMYCMMARTCASINHDGDYPTFDNTEELTKKEVDDQYRIAGEFMQD